MIPMIDSAPGVTCIATRGAARHGDRPPDSLATGRPNTSNRGTNGDMADERKFLSSGNSNPLYHVVIVLFILFSLYYVGTYFYEQSMAVTRPIRISVGAVLFAFAAYVIYWVAASAYWCAVLRTATDTTVGLFQGFVHLSMMAVGKYLPGKAWGIAARSSHMKSEGVAVSRGLLATFYEQLITVHSALVFSAGLALIYAPGPAVLLIACAAAASLPATPYVQGAAFALLRRILPARTKAVDLRHMPMTAYLSLLGAMIIVWLLNGLVFVGLYVAFISPDIDAGLIARLLFANTIGIVTGFFALFAPAGIGVREGVSIAIMAPAIGLEEAVLLSLLHRLWSVAGEFGVGAIALVTIFYGHRTRSARKRAE